MQKDVNKEELINNILVHMYHSVVVGTLDSIATILQMKVVGGGMNPRHKDLKHLYDTLGLEGRRLFYDAVVSIAEFVSFSALFFVERYNRFESEDNRDEYPRLSLIYDQVVEGEVNQQSISKFGSDELGKAFKRIARNDEINSLVEATIKNIIGSEKGT